MTLYAFELYFTFPLSFVICKDKLAASTWISKLFTCWLNYIIKFWIVKTSVLYVAAEHLLMLLKSNVTRQVPTIVFCNRSTTACFLSSFLNSNNIRHVCLHAKMSEKVGLFISFLWCSCSIYQYLSYLIAALILIFLPSLSLPALLSLFPPVPFVSILFLSVPFPFLPSPLLPFSCLDGVDVGLLCITSYVFNYFLFFYSEQWSSGMSSDSDGCSCLKWKIVIIVHLLCSVYTELYTFSFI